MIERREFISICRQIGTMMEVGVDFLRITQALRAQTDNPRLLELFDQLDADLKAGDSLSEALSHAPDVFSPFAVSLVQQGEARGDIEGAWQRIADFFRQEAKEDLEIGDDGTALEPLGVSPSSRERTMNGLAVSAPRAVSPALAFDWERAQRALAQALLGAALLLVCLSAAHALVEVGAVERRFAALLELGTAALFLSGASAWMMWPGRRNREEEPEAECAFCGRIQTAEVPLVALPQKAGASICTVCAATIAAGAPLAGEERDEHKRAQRQALQNVADALPKEEPDSLDETIVLDENDPLAPDPLDSRPHA